MVIGGGTTTVAARVANGVTASLGETTWLFRLHRQLVGAGDFITFANFAFPTALPVQFEVDADRVEGGEVIVHLSNGSTKTGTFGVDEAERVNKFTGAGLVNADKATRQR